MADKSVDAVEKVLGKPAAGDLTDNALKVRRNLLAFGLISIFIAIGEIRLDPTSSVLGFKFIGISENLVRNVFLATTSYFLIHFAWYALESFLEWRLRLTGTRLAFVTGARLGSEHADYPDDPRQSTLYTWWLDNAKRIGSFRSTADDLSQKIKTWEEKVNPVKQDGNGLNLANAMSSLTHAQSAIERLRGQIESVEKLLSAQRIPCSLGRFDEWFKLFLNSQNIRWILIDILVPIVVGAAAIYLLAKQ